MALFMLSLRWITDDRRIRREVFSWRLLASEAPSDHKNWYYWLAFWAIINTVVSFYYYVRFIKVMYLGDRIADDKPLALSGAPQTVSIRCSRRDYFYRNLSTACYRASQEVD